MPTKTDTLEQNIAKILKGDRTTNLIIKYLWYGSNAAQQRMKHIQTCKHPLLAAGYKYLEGIHSGNN